MTDVKRNSPAPPDSSRELHGHGLRLCSWDVRSREHVEAWLRGLTDPDFRQWNTPLKTVDNWEDALASMWSKAAGVANGTNASFRITDAEGGGTLGHIGVNEIDHVLRVARVGYWILPEARGRGVASRALALTARWALTDLGLNRLELGHALGHEASCRVAERCGFPFEGTLRGAMFEAGRKDVFRDVHLHARIASDPEPEIP